MFYCIQPKNSVRAPFQWTINHHKLPLFFSEDFPNTLLVLVPVFTSGQWEASRHKGVLLKNKSKLPIKFVLFVYASILSIKCISHMPTNSGRSRGKGPEEAKPFPPPLHPSDLGVNFNTCLLKNSCDGSISFYH